MNTGDTHHGGRFLFYGLVLLAVYLAYLVIQPFMQPLLWASVLALTLQPFQRRLRPRLGEAVPALKEASIWMGKMLQSNPDAALADATPYLRLFGLAAGGRLALGLVVLAG